MIRSVIEKYKMKNMVSYLCGLVGVSRSGYYNYFSVKSQEHRVVPNLLNKQFKQGVPGKILLTDITYLHFGKVNRAYLSAIKDGSTGEILAYHISDRMTLDIATDTLKKLKMNKNFMKAKDALIHSDQGVHYTSPIFQKAVKKLGLRQSMSRRGNCWDNAPPRVILWPS